MIHTGFWAVVPDEGCSKDSALWIHFHSTWPHSQAQLGETCWAETWCCFPAQPTGAVAKNICLRWCQTHRVPRRITRFIPVLPLTPTTGPSSSCAWCRGRGSCTAAGAGSGDRHRDRCSGSRGFTASPTAQASPVCHPQHVIWHAQHTPSCPDQCLPPSPSPVQDSLLNRQVCRAGLSEPASESPFRYCGVWLSVTLTDEEIRSLHRSKWFCKIRSESYQPDAFIKLHLWPRLDKRKGVAN